MPPPPPQSPPPPPPPLLPGRGPNRRPGWARRTALPISLDAAEFKPGRWSKRKVGAERWVRPSLVVEVAFGEWPADKRIRHAVFRGIRTDKPAKMIVRERVKNPAAPALAPVAPES